MSGYMDEQDQVDLIKNTWKKYGNWLLTVILLIVLAMTGYRYWQNHQQKQKNQASVAYMSLLDSVSKNQPVEVNAKAKHIIQVMPKTAYAGMAALILASMNADQGDTKGAQANLNWALKNQKDKDILALAKIRLARLYNAEKKPADAIKVLTPVSKGYEASFNLALGNAYAQQNQIAKAKAAYQASIDAAGTKLPIGGIAQMKLHNLPKDNA